MVIGGWLVAAACGACRAGHERSGSPLTTVRIAVGGQHQLMYLPATLASELGFYKDEGLSVAIQDVPEGTQALEALAGGTADVVGGFYDHTIQMAAEGREVVAFVSMLRSPGLALVTSPQSAGKVTTIEHLKGRIVGVTTAGSSSQVLVSYLLQQHGVGAAAVHLTAIGTGATAIAAIEHGTVDAGMMADPAFTLVLRRNPGVRVLADLRRGDGVKAVVGSTMYPGSVLYSSGDWVRANRDTARRLARAITRTLVWMQTHPPQEIAARTPAAFRGEDQALFVDALTSSMPMYSPDGVMEMDGAEAVKRLLGQSMEKVRYASFSLARTYTNEFVPQRLTNP